MWGGDQGGFRFCITSLGLLMEHLDSGRRQIATNSIPSQTITYNLRNSSLFFCHKKKASHINKTMLLDFLNILETYECNN